MARNQFTMLLGGGRISQCCLRASRAPMARPSRPSSRPYSHKPSASKSSSTSTSTPPQKPKKTLHRGIILTLILGGITYSFAGSSTSNQPTLLNTTTFAPYTIISRIPMSPSSFVLTVVPHTPNPDPPYLLPGTNRWRHPLWSVEIKQPEVQIARHYTPLPPSTSTDDGAASGALRFYIRTIGDGEMSRYLNRLREGQDVYLRGPHLGFDLVKRLGARKSIVFLAGGTGVVPGMQAARIALDGYEDTKVSLLWAVRTHHEVRQETTPAKGGSVSTSIAQPRPWWDFSRGPRDPAELEPASLGEWATPVAGQLAEMKKLYGDRLSVQVVVDEEGSAFQQQHIQKALQNITEGEEDTAPSNPGSGCSLHSQKYHEVAAEFEPESPNCKCAPVEGTLPGKNILIVSGPEGFVAHYAGPKGAYDCSQGPVGGVVGQMQVQNPQLAQDWLVLKL